jgi:hypothetical protein
VILELPMFIANPSPVEDVLMLATGGTIGLDAILRLRVGEDGDVLIAATMAFGAAGCNARTATCGSSFLLGKIMPAGTVL